MHISIPPIVPLRDHLPTRVVPFVNYALIAANVLAFLWQESQILAGLDPEVLARTFGLIPARFVVDPVGTLPTVFTSMFTHAGIGHIAGNMLFLWIFGDNVEEALGHVRYLVFYFLGGICACAAQTAAALGDPAALNVPLIGASGAISAVLAAYAFLYPRSPITVINPFVFLFLIGLLFGLFWSFPAWFVILVFFLTNLVDAFANSNVGGVAFMAHVGGFLAGVLFLRPFMAGRVRMDDYARWQRLRGPRSLRDPYPH